MSDVEIEWTPKARAVLAAAGELFYSHGIHAVGVDTIAERAGVTKKTLYDRFGSKERLVVEYLTARDHAWREFLARHLDLAGDDPRSRLVAVFDASAAWAAEQGGKGCSMINAHAEISDPTHAAYSVIVGQKRWMLDLFLDIATEACDADSTRAREVAESLMLLHEGAFVIAGIGTIDSAFDRARDLAAALLDVSRQHSS